MKYLFAFFFTLCIHCCFGESNHTYFKHYPENQGLSSGEVYSFAQDKNGFIWYGGSLGVFRFDGKNTVQLSEILGIKKDYFLNGAVRLYFDNNQDLWVLCHYKALYKCNLIEKKVEKIEIDSSTILDFRISTKGEILVAHEGGLDRLNEKGEIQQNIYDQEVLGLSANSTYRAAFYTKKNDIFFQNQDGEWEELIQEPIRKRKETRYIYRIDSTKILLGSIHNGELSLFDSDTKKDTILLRNTSVYGIESDKNRGVYWIATDKGIYKYHLHNNSFLQIRANPRDQHGLTDNHIKGIFRDIDNNMWIGTFYKGLGVYPNYTHDFTFVDPDTDNGDLQGNVVKDFVDDRNGNLWIATEDAGLFHFDQTKKVYTQITNPSQEDALATSNTQCLEIINEQLWIGTLDNGIEVMDLKTRKKINNFNMFSSCKLPYSYVLDMAQTGDSIYIGTYIGLFQYFKNENTFKKILPGTIGKLHIDDQGTLWIGCNQHIYYKTTKGKLEKLSNDIIGFNGLISDIKQSSSDTIWAIGYNKIASISIHQKKYIKCIEIANENNKYGFAHRIEIDSVSNCWLATSKGLLFYNNSRKSEHFYPADTDLKKNRIYTSSYTDSKGNVYFGSLSGYIKIKPKSNNTDLNQNKVQISELEFSSKNKEEVYKIYQGYDNIITSNYLMNDVKISLSSLQYKDLTLERYYYQLQGYDDQIYSCLNNHIIDFKNLEAGNYTFIAGKDRHLLEKDATQNICISFKITPPIWKSPLAYFSYSLLAISILLLLVKKQQQLRLKRKHEQLQEKQKQQEVELQNAQILFFANMAHEIRTPLSVISLILEKLLLSKKRYTQEHSDLESIKSLTASMNRLCDQMLQRQTDKMNTMTFINTDINKITKEILSPYEKIIRFKQIDYSLHFHCESILIDIDQDSYAKIIANLISNAIKYTQSFIHLEYRVSNQSLEILFTNDGETLSKEDKEKLFQLYFRAENQVDQDGYGMGLAMVKQLVEMHKGTIEITKHQFTQFRVSLPLTQIPLESTHKIPVEQISNPQFSNQFHNDRETILIVEDDKTLRESEARLFAPNYNVLLANNGKMALELLNQYAVNLIISDIIMKEMDGLELCARIKQSSQFQHIPIILISGDNNLQTQDRAKSYGIEQFLAKPFSAHLLSSTAAKLLADIQKKKKRVLFSENDQITVNSKESNDILLLQNFYSKVEEELSNCNLNIDILAERLGVGRSTLYKKVKETTGSTPNEYIRLARLKRACYLLTVKQQIVKEVAYNVGFSSTTYFATSFLKQYGMSPSEYVKKYSAIQHPL